MFYDVVRKLKATSKKLTIFILVKVENFYPMLLNDIVIVIVV